jgi:hypothetical protein
MLSYLCNPICRLAVAALSFYSVVFTIDRVSAAVGSPVFIRLLRHNNAGSPRGGLLKNTI